MFPIATAEGLAPFRPPRSPFSPLLAAEVGLLLLLLALGLPALKNRKAALW